MGSKKVRYYVYYGHHTSRYPCYSLKEVHNYISYCLREGTPITGVAKA